MRPRRILLAAERAVLGPGSPGAAGDDGEELSEGAKEPGIWRSRVPGFQGFFANIYIYIER